MIRAAELRYAHAIAAIYIASRERHIAFAPLAHSKEEVSWIDHLYVHPDKDVAWFWHRDCRRSEEEAGRADSALHVQQNQRACRFYERLDFVALRFSDGSENEERCPDVVYRWEKKPNPL